MSRNAPRIRSKTPLVSVSVRLPAGVKLRADVAALHEGKSLAALIGDLVTEAFTAAGPLDALIGRVAECQYDVDAPFVTRNQTLKDIQSRIDALSAAIRQEHDSLDADVKRANRDLAESLRKTSAQIAAANAPIQEPDQE